MSEPTPAGDDELDRRPFDELVTELQRIVSTLETGSAGLEESIALYRDGLRVHAACERRLRDAELAISELGRRGLTGAEPADAADAADAAEPATGEPTAGGGSQPG
jgi:exodeoxyribonuclease VII small subunit